MENKNIDPPKKRNAKLLIARIFSSVFALLYTLALGPKLIGRYFNLEDTLSGETWEEWVMELTFYIFMMGFVFSWWKKCAGGIIIIIASVLQMAPFLIIDGNWGSLIFGVPILISGSLFLWVCFDNKKSLSN